MLTHEFSGGHFSTTKDTKYTKGSEWLAFVYLLLFVVQKLRQGQL
jgi:hypothetical protein